MSKIFEVTDKNGKEISLSSERWKHITSTHNEMNNYLDEIKIAITTPLKIIMHEKGGLFDYYFYLKHREHPEKYLKVIVKYLNGSGFVITTYFVRNIK